MPEPLCQAVREKVGEQIDRTLHLIELLPDESCSGLLGHLLECLAGFCAVLAAAEPERLAAFSRLRGLPVNHACPRAEAVARIAEYREAIAEGFGWLRDGDLARRIPTVFVADGEAVLTLLLGNLEHLINHKHQLFLEARRLGASVGTADLYCFRK